MDRRIRQGTGKGQLNGIFADRLEAIENDILINTFKQAIIDGTTVEELYWQNIMSPYPSRESDIIYMLKPLVK